MFANGSAIGIDYCMACNRLTRDVAIETSTKFGIGKSSRNLAEQFVLGYDEPEYVMDSVQYTIVQKTIVYISIKQTN